jgi:hypothetical protein
MLEPPQNPGRFTMARMDMKVNMTFTPWLKGLRKRPVHSADIATLFDAHHTFGRPSGHPRSRHHAGRLLFNDGTG